MQRNGGGLCVGLLRRWALMKAQQSRMPSGKEGISGLVIRKLFTGKWRD